MIRLSLSLASNACPRLLTTLGLLAVFVSTLDAAPVVNFSPGDIVATHTNAPRGTGVLTAPIDLDGDGNDDAQRVLAYSDTVPINATVTTSLPSGIYYGGNWIRYHDFLNGGNSTYPVGVNMILNAIDGTADGHQLGANLGVVIPVPVTPHSNQAYASRGQVSTLFLWQQHDGFAPGMQTGNVVVTNPTAFTARLRGGSNNAGLIGRWMVRKGAALYVSSESFTLSGTMTTVTSSAATSTTWAPLDVSGSYPVVSGTFAPLALEDITGAGIFAAADVTSGGGAVVQRVQLVSFTLDGELNEWPTPVGYHPGTVTYYNNPYFANGLKTNDGWKNSTGSIVLTPASGRLNANGYPTALLSGETFLELYVWASSSIYQSPWGDRDSLVTGKVVLTWTGDADLRLNAGTFISGESSGASTGVLTNGRRVYQLTSANAPRARLYALGATPLTDAAAWLPDPADPINQSLEGQTFHPAFLDLLNTRNWAYVRMMMWGSTNASPEKDWIDRRPPSYGYFDGVLNPRDPTEGLIWYHDSNGQPVYYSGDRTTGVPWEIIIQAANAAGKDLWICVPHLATDDYLDKLSKLVAYGSDGTNPYTAPQTSPVWAPLASNLKVYVEYSNEIWASSSNFAQGPWAEAKAAALGLTRPQFVALRSSQAWAEFEQEMGASRVVRVAPARTSSPTYTTNLLTELRDNPALLKPEYLAVTTYFGYGIQHWALDKAVRQAATSDPWFATGTTFTTSTGGVRPVTLDYTSSYWTGSDMDRHIGETIDQMIIYALSGTAFDGDTGQDTVNQIGGFSDGISNVAANFQLPLIAYEGGPSIYSDKLDGGDPRDNGITNFMNALNRDPRFIDVYRIVMEMSFAKGLVTHCLFTDAGKWGKWGQWGHLEYLTQPPASAAKWQYMIELYDEFSGLRPVIDPIGAVPSFVTPADLPRSEVGQAYSQTIQTTGGDGARSVTLIQAALAPGLSFNPATLTVSGTPTAGKYNYLLLRVQDADGDAAWRIFSFQSVSRSTDPAIVVEFESLVPDSTLQQPFALGEMTFRTSSPTVDSLRVAGVTAVKWDLKNWASTCLMTHAWNVDHIFERTDGHPFDLYSLDVASHQGDTVTISARVHGGSIINYTTTIPLQKAPFTNIVLDWVQLDWVEVHFGTAAGNRWGVIDNLRINQVP